MKRIALIVAAAVLLLAGMGGGAYFYLKPGFFARSETPAQASNHKTTAATNAADKKTSDGEDLLHLVRNLGGIQDRIIYGDRDALAIGADRHEPERPVVGNVGRPDLPGEPQERSAPSLDRQPMCIGLRA